MHKELLQFSNNTLISSKCAKIASCLTTRERRRANWPVKDECHLIHAHSPLTLQR